MSNLLARRDSAKSQTLTGEQYEDLHAAFDSVSSFNHHAVYADHFAMIKYQGAVPQNAPSLS